MKTITKFSLPPLLFFLLASTSTKAQEFDEIFRAGPEDTNLYMENYIKPIIFSFNNGLASGWNNTAKPHKMLGFDITASVNIANIPDEDKFFDFDQAGFQNLILTGGNNILPSVVGGETDATLALAAQSEIESPEGTLTYNAQTPSFGAADGIDIEDIPLAGFPVPTVQLGIGLVKNTDLKIRFIPTINTEELEFGLFGIGILHDLKQWIPGFKQLPIDISGFFGYTGLNAEYVIDVNDPGDFRAQGTAEFKASATTIQVLASKKISVLTPYLGIGYNFAGSSFKVNGTYVFEATSDDVTVDTEASFITITDPVDLEFDGASSPRLTAGFRLKLLILTLHADYTFQKYSTLSAGVGISVR